MKRPAIKSLIGITTFAVVVVSLIACVYYSNTKEEQLQETVRILQEKSLQELYFKSKDYNRFTQQITTTTAFIANSQMLHHFITQPDDEKIIEINSLFASIINNFPWYKKVSFIDLQGIERFYVTPKENIQSSQHKVNLALLNYAKTLAPGTVGEWGIHITTNYQNGDTTYEPSLIRIAPIIIKNQKSTRIVGYIATDIDVNYLSHYFKQGSVKMFNIEVLNNNGFYLSSNHTHKLFGQQIPERKNFNFKEHHPTTWQFMSKNASGCSYEFQELTCFYKKAAPHKRNIFFITHYTKEDIEAYLSPKLDKINHTVQNIFSLSLLFLVPFIIIRYNMIKHRLESQLASAALNSMAAILLTDHKNRIIHVNAEFESLTGYKNKDILGLDPNKSILNSKHFQLTYNIIKHTTVNKRWESETSFINQQGHKLYLIIRSYAVLSRKGIPEYFITYLIDNTERKNLEKQLKLLSEKDGLTKLWNRRRFDQELKAQAQLAARYEKRHTATLVILDIDYFKAINDAQGHDMGDVVLTRLADSLTEQLRDSDFLARIGGEEFAIIMNYTSCYEAHSAIERIRINIEQDVNLPITISIGLTPININNPTLLFKRADQALYRSKSLGRNQTQCECNYVLTQVQRA